MRKVVLRHGIIGSLLLIALAVSNWVFIAPNFSVSTSQGFGYLGIILSLMVIPLGIKSYRDKHNNGLLSFSKALKIGAAIALFIAVVMFFEGIIFHALEGDKFQDWQLKDLEGAELEAMKARLDGMPAYTKALWFQGVIMFTMLSIFGLAISLISAVFLKKT